LTLVPLPLVEIAPGQDVRNSTSTHGWPSVCRAHGRAGPGLSPPCAAWTWSGSTRDTLPRAARTRSVPDSGYGEARGRGPALDHVGRVEFW